jgi:hypothetical protein
MQSNKQRIFGWRRCRRETTSGFKVVRERTIWSAKQNAEVSLALLASALAKDIHDAFAIQGR